MNSSAPGGRRKGIAGLLIVDGGVRSVALAKMHGIRKISADQSGTADF